MKKAYEVKKFTYYKKVHKFSNGTRTISYGFREQ